MKTKAQMRKEAVERLQDTCMSSGDAVKKIAAAIGSEWEPPSVNKSLGRLQSKLIDLLTDDDTNDTFSPNKVVSGDADTSNDNDLDLDSREKLEADVREADELMRQITHGETHLDEHVILGWLDRQAAITEQDCCDKCFNVQKQLEESLKENIRLEKERDEYKAQWEEREAVCEECESDHDKQLFAMLEQRNEARCDRDKLSSQNKELRMQLKHMTYSRDLWKSRYTEVKPILDRNGMPIKVGDVLFGQDNVAWRVYGFDKDSKHSVKAECISVELSYIRNLKPEWLSHFQISIPKEDTKVLLNLLENDSTYAKHVLSNGIIEYCKPLYPDGRGPALYFDSEGNNILLH